MSENTVIFIGGYSRSGKSSSISILRDKFNIPCLSTSECLHQVKERILDSFPMIPRPTTKEEERTLCITLAESVLVPVYTRYLFGRWVSDQIENHYRKIIVVETIGGEEHDILVSCLDPSTTYHCWNIRRQSELSGVDIRKLLVGGDTVWNNGTLFDLERLLSAKLKTVRDRQLVRC